MRYSPGTRASRAGYRHAHAPLLQRFLMRQAVAPTSWAILCISRCWIWGRTGAMPIAALPHLDHSHQSVISDRGDVDRAAWRRRIAQAEMGTYLVVLFGLCAGLDDSTDRHDSLLSGVRAPAACGRRRYGCHGTTSSCQAADATTKPHTPVYACAVNDTTPIA